MDITTEDLCNLFSSLRSSNTTENQSANNKLQELVKYPNTIFCLFSLLGFTQDQTLRCYAYFMLANCFRSVRTQMNQDFYFQCRQQIIDLLQNEENLQCIEALITVLQILIDPNTPWPEIIQFAFSINYTESQKNLFLALSIFNGIISSLSPELILQNQQNLMNLAISGLKEDAQCQQIITVAVSFLYTIYITFQTKTPAQIPGCSIFQERLLEIFFYSIESSDINYFIQIISSIIMGYDANVFIFPATSAMPKIISILQNDQYDIIFRLTVHDFFIISLSNQNYSSLLTKDDWNILAQIEGYITNLIILASDEIDVNMWFDDVLNGVSIFLARLTSDEAVAFTMSQGQLLIQKSTMGSPTSISDICFLLLWFYNCVASYQEHLNEEQIEFIYQQFLHAMNSHVQILMSLSGNYLIDLFKYFEKIVNGKYILQTLSSILIYLNEVSKEDQLLYSFVCILENSDPIFNNLIEICSQLINSGAVFAQRWAYFVMGESISRSNTAAYELFDSLYDHFLCIINVPQLLIQMPHSLVLICLNALINLSPERIHPLIDEFLVPIMTTFSNTKDPFLIQYILSVLDSVANYKILVKSLSFEYYELMASEFPRLIDKDWKTKIENSMSVESKYQKVIQKFMNASHALEILTKFTIEYKQFVIENSIMKYLLIFFQSLKIIIDTFDNSNNIFNTLILIIGNNEFLKRGEKQPFEINELQKMKDEIQTNPSEDLVAKFGESKLRLELYMQEIAICQDIYQYVIELFELANEANFASNLLIIIKLLVANKCVDPSQFSNIINITLRIINTLNFNSICIFQFAHLICEMAKKVGFDSVCDIIMPFVKQLFEDQGNTKLIIDAITFIKNLDDFSFMFLQKPEMNSFWSSITNIIADQSTNKEIASATVKMMSTICQKLQNREQIFPIAKLLLESAKARFIAEINTPSGLRDNLAAFLSILGSSVIGDNFPFQELIPLILTVIPLRHDFSLCSEIYQFISSICNVVIFKNEEMKNLYVCGLIDLLSQPYSKIKLMNIDIFVLRSLLHSLTDVLYADKNEEQFLKIVLQILCGDQVRFSMFVQSFNRIRLLSFNEWDNIS